MRADAISAWSIQTSIAVIGMHVAEHIAMDALFAVQGLVGVIAMLHILWKGRDHGTS